MNVRDNDHVTIPELRGFVSDDLFGALAEAQAVSKGTKCRQPVFSLSLNPPKGAQVDTETFIAVADRAEEVLGLKDHPRAIVIHEKDGRKHAHVVWSRIDLTQMKAVNHSHFKMKLNALSKELYLEHGWELPEGHKTNGWKNPLNFSLAEWQQAKRLDLDPREIKQVFQNAWQQSDNLPSFRNALEEHGYYLAKGDRRGIVALDVHGEVYSLSRWIGVKTKALEQKLGKADGLPGVEKVRVDNQKRISKRLRGVIAQDLEKKQAELQPMTDRARRMAQSHRAERELLQKKQGERLKAENKARAARFKRGLGAVLDLLTGRLFAVRKENEQDAFKGYLRDRAQREQLFSTQLKERAALQKTIDAMKSRHRTERMEFARQIADMLRLTQEGERSLSHGKDSGLELHM
jgi:hypothetical protein